MDAELEEFKRIDLRQYAAAQGYSLDYSESWRSSSVMRRQSDDDKIIVKLDHDGHYVYFSVRDEDDNGTIIDFVQRRKDCSLGRVRRELRPWIGLRPDLVLPALKESRADRGHVEIEFRNCWFPERHAFLERTRKISPALLQWERFKGHILMDWHHNAVFPHRDANGICGLEKQNHNYIGFSEGGEKGLWLSEQFPGDHRLVICESGVKALSYAQLFPDDRTIYGSIAGTMSPEQPCRIRAVVAGLPDLREVVAAMDHDKDGMKHAEKVGLAVANSRRDVGFCVDLPPNPGQGWNDVLLENYSLPAARGPGFPSP
jgi:hypothetical protein